MAQMQSVSNSTAVEFGERHPPGRTGESAANDRFKVLLARVGRRKTAPDSSAASRAWTRKLAQPLADTAAALARWEVTHAAPGERADSPPRLRVIPAAAQRGAEDAGEDAAEAEAALARQCFRLLMATLRAAATAAKHSRNGAADGDLADVIELANIIATRRTGKEIPHG